MPARMCVLCDDLESKLNRSHTDGAKLMEAVVAELVGVWSQVRRVAYLRYLPPIALSARLSSNIVFSAFFTHQTQNIPQFISHICYTFLNSSIKWNCQFRNPPKQENPFDGSKNKRIEHPRCTTRGRNEVSTPRSDTSLWCRKKYVEKWKTRPDRENRPRCVSGGRNEVSTLRYDTSLWRRKNMWKICENEKHVPTVNRTRV